MAQQVKAGDVVHVRAVVIQEIDGGNSLLIGCNETSQYENTSARAVVSRDTIVHVEPRALQVGDNVTWGFGGLIGEIKAIGGGRACVQITSLAIGTTNSHVGALVTLPIGNFTPVAV